MAERVDSPRVLNIADLRLLAKRRLPRVAFDYIDGGADGEVTLRENCRIFDDVMFRPRCAVSAPADLRTRVLGHDLALPFALAPVGSSRMFYPRGEEVAAKAAGAAGTAYTLSTLSGCLLEDVAKASSGPVFYQLYLLGGRDSGVPFSMASEEAPPIPVAPSGSKRRLIAGDCTKTRHPLPRSAYTTRTDDWRLTPCV
jgi:L-lactate dehydrogenase (cytochrome)